MIDVKSYNLDPRREAALDEDLKTFGHNLKEWTYQTYASICIGGTSGKGAPWAVSRLHSYVARGFLEMRNAKHPRGIQFKATPAVIEYASQFPNPYPYPLE
jgi:hypothetical protein